MFTNNVFLMRKSFLFVLFLCTGLFSVAQVGDSTMLQPNTKAGRVYGKVVDSKSNRGVEAASVQVFIVNDDSLGGNQTDSLIGGMLSRPNGDFNFDNLLLIDTFKFIISAVGYK